MTEPMRLTFRSPINLEGSWGECDVAEDVESTMILTFHKDGSGSIEWECEEGDVYEEIGLEFEYDNAGKRKLVGYDGVMTLPDQAMDLLEKYGVDCAEMRKSLGD